MKNKYTEQVSRTFEVELPYAESMDEYIDLILPSVRAYSEDLDEDQFFLNRPWLEMKDDDNFHDKVLHMFHEGGEYLVSINGDVGGGSWRDMEYPNKLLLEYGGNAELYELAFLNSTFFILKKHGDQTRFGQPKYFVMINESVGNRLEWRDAMELLFNTYRTNNNFYITIGVIMLLVIAIIGLLSIG